VHTIVKLLLEYHANITAKVDDGWTTLHLLVNNLHEDYEGIIALIRLFLDHVADVTAQNKDGWAVLHVLAENLDQKNQEAFQQATLAVIRLLLHMALIAASKRKMVRRHSI